MLEGGDRFVEIPLHTSGVYALVCQRRVVYIGKSINVLSRISTHRNNMRRKIRGKPTSLSVQRPVIIFDRVFVRFCPENELDMWEFRMIDKYKPEMNILLKRKRSFDFDLSTLGNGKWMQQLKPLSSGFVRRF